MKKQRKQRVTKRCVPGYTLKEKDGYYIPRKIGLTGQQVKEDPRFANSRLMAAWFGQVARWSKAIVYGLMRGTRVKNMMPRLTGLLRRSIGSEAGQQLFLSDIDWATLKGFGCNKDQNLADVLQIDHKLAWQEGKRQYWLSLPAFKPAESIRAPEGATHARIVLLHTCLDVEGNPIVTDRFQSTLLPLKHITVKPKSMRAKLDAIGYVVSILALGVEWYRQDAKTKTISWMDSPIVAQIIDVRTDFWD